MENSVSSEEECVSQSWADLWAVCTDYLGSSEEARFIIEQASGRSGAAWLLSTDAHASPSAANKVREMCRRRKAGEPLQYVLGRWGFRMLNLHCDKRALIPRPETEVLVDVALAVLRDKQAPALVLDLGTGTGAIAISVATECTGVQVWATDVSVPALELARQNLDEVQRTHDINVELVHSDWFASVPRDLRGNLDLVISNPPYIAEVERSNIDRQVVDWEPESALFAGLDGLDDLNRIVDESFEWLAPGGSLLVELAPDQASTLKARAEERGYGAAAIGPDLTGRDRWLLAMKH